MDRGPLAHLRNACQGRAEFGEDRFPSRSNIGMKRIELFQSTSLHGSLASHRLPIPPVFPPTQNYGKLLLHQICLINGDTLAHNHFIRPVKFPPTSTCCLYIETQKAPYRLLTPFLGRDWRWDIFRLGIYSRCIDIQRSREEVYPSPV
jgi:hypothetical protein